MLAEVPSITQDKNNIPKHVLVKKMLFSKSFGRFSFQTIIFIGRHIEITL